jgi:hypothetical protein
MCASSIQSCEISRRLFELDMEAPDDIHDYQKQLLLAQLAVSGGESLDYSYDNIRLISKLESWDTLIRLDEHI